MAKINVEVNVKESAFEAFASKFKAYQDKLDKTPGAWEKVSRSSEESATHFEMMTVALSQQAADMGKIADRIGGVRRESEAVSRSWRNLARDTRSVAGNIAGATMALIKWSGVIGMVTGAFGLLTGYAGFEGMSSLGAGVARGRSAALGLGTSYGGRRSFLTNFERLGDAGGLLARVNEISHSADNTPLLALGLTQQQAQGDTADVGANAILRLKRLVDSVKDTRFLQDALHANRADELISLQQAQVLRGMSPNEVQSLVASYRRDKRQMDLGTGVQKKWQDFSTQLTRAGKEIENTFVKRLGVLTPSLEKLSEAAVKLTDKLMEKNGPVAELLDKLSGGVEWLADEIDNPDFRAKVEGFISGAAKLAEGAVTLLGGILNLAASLGITPAEASPETPRGGAAFGGISGLRAKGEKYGILPYSGGNDHATGPAADTKAVIDKAAAAHGVDPHVLYGIVAGESAHGDHYDVGDHGMSWSAFQMYLGGGLGNEFERQTGKSVRDPKNFPLIADWVANYIAHGGSLGNWHGYRGPRNWSPRWGNMGYSAPKVPANVNTRITINKPPGNDANVSAAAAATP